MFRYEIQDLIAKKKKWDNMICQEREMRGEKRERKEWVAGDILRLFLTYPILLKRSRWDNSNYIFKNPPNKVVTNFILTSNKILNQVRHCLVVFQGIIKIISSRFFNRYRVCWKWSLGNSFFLFIFFFHLSLSCHITLSPSFFLTIGSWISFLGFWIFMKF